MKRASTLDNDEAIFEAMLSPSSKSFVKLEWDDAGAWRPLEDLDIETFVEWMEDFRRVNYSSFALSPVSSNLNFSVLNMDGRYSESSITEFSNILIPNRKIRLSGGYKVPDSVVEEYEFPLRTGTIRNGFALDEMERLILDATRTGEDPAPYLVDLWATLYGSALYDSVTYSAAGYWIATYDNQATGILSTFKTISVAANNARTRVLYRCFNNREAFEAANTTSASWTDLGVTVDGTKVFDIDEAGFRYIQIAIVADGTTWSSGDRIDGVAVGLESFVEFVYRSVFHLDTPAYPEPPAPEIPRVVCTARDAWRAALEIPALLPDVSGKSLDEILKLTCDQVGILYSTESISDLAPLGVRGLSSGTTTTKKIDEISDWIAQISTQLNGAEKIRYKMFLKYDEVLRDNILYLQPRTSKYEAVFCFQSRYYNGIGDRSRNYDKKLYRITVTSNKGSVGPETEIATSTVTTPGDYVLTWSGIRAYKRIFLKASSGSPTIEILDVAGGSATVRIGGIFTMAAISVCGCAYTGTPPIIGEFMKVGIDGKIAGQAIEIENPLLLDNAEAARIAKGFLDEYGDPTATCNGLDYPYLHLTPEATDMVALWARFSFDDNLYRVLGRRYSWNYLGGTTSFDLEDSGMNFSDVSSFKYDEDDGVIKHDAGFLYDMQDGPRGAGDDAINLDDLVDIEFISEPRPTPPVEPIMWCRCGNSVHSEYGDDVALLGAAGYDMGPYSGGPFGGAIKAESASAGVLLPASALSTEEGCIEFWLARTVANPSSSPQQLMTYDDGPSNVLIRYSAAAEVGTYAWYVNMALGGGADSLWRLDHNFAWGDEDFPVGTSWRHFALTWRKNTIGDDEVWLSFDGVNRVLTKGAGNTTGKIGWGTTPFTTQIFRYTYNTYQWKGKVDNIKAWDYAKLDFSDRFTEGL